MKKVLFVCMGNICRSPTAEGVFRKILVDADLTAEIEVDSAGTHDYHVGASPDTRATLHAAKRGYDLTTLVGRQISARDFDYFDYILVMDEMNHRNVKSICPSRNLAKVELLLNYSDHYHGEEVPDPYQGNERGFENVLDMIEDGCKGLLEFLQSRRT